MMSTSIPYLLSKLNVQSKKTRSNFRHWFQEGVTVLSAIFDLISSIDKNINLNDCKRMKSKAANSFINKVIVTLDSVACRDKLINKSKSVLKGKGININPDLTKLQMEADYYAKKKID